MKGDERRVVDAFAGWLEAGGWHVRREVDFCDLLASRDSETLYTEAKGRTAAVGLDVDTLYGQLLRRMPIAEDPAARFAVVVPTEGAAAAARVPPRVRQLLRIDLYEVDVKGTVRAIPGAS
jgi:hypothetical protein